MMLILLRVDGLDHEMEVRILGVVRKTKERMKRRELVRKTLRESILQSSPNPGRLVPGKKIGR